VERDDTLEKHSARWQYVTISCQEDKAVCLPLWHQ